MVELSNFVSDTELALPRSSGHSTIAHTIRGPCMHGASEARKECPCFRTLACLPTNLKRLAGCAIQCSSMRACGRAPATVFERVCRLTLPQRRPPGLQPLLRQRQRCWRRRPGKWPVWQSKSSSQGPQLPPWRPSPVRPRPPGLLCGAPSSRAAASALPKRTASSASHGWAGAGAGGQELKWAGQQNSGLGR